MKWQKFLTEWYGVFGTLNALIISAVAFVFWIGPLWLFRQVRFKQRHGWIIEFETVNDSVFDKVWAQKHNWGGFCSGNWIVYNHRFSDSVHLQSHERRHAWQIFVFGIFQPIVYVVHLVYLWIRLKNLYKAYKKVCWEVDADAAADAFVESEQNNELD